MTKQDWKTIGLVGIVAAYIILSKIKKESGVGKVERVKRRIYKEVSLAQDAGIDFTKKVDELNNHDRELLDELGANAGWKQSKRSVESGKPYADAYYGSLRRAWNAVSGLGIRGIGRAYNVKDADGNTVLTWIEDAAAHVEAERRTLEAEKRAAEARRNLRKNRRERRNQTPVVVSPSVPEVVENYNQEPEIEAEREEVVVETPKVKKPTKKELKLEEANERRDFAESFIENWLKEHPHSWLKKGSRNIDTKIADWNNRSVRDIVIDEFTEKKIKIKKVPDWEYAIQVFLLNEYQSLGKADNGVGQLVWELLQGWENRYIDAGFAREDLDDLRRALLDKAKHMQVYVDRGFVPKVYKYREKPYNWTQEEYEQRKESMKVLQDPIITGDDRYNYLPFINWIVLVRQHYDTAGTYYPVRSYKEKIEAESWAKGRYGKNARVYPIWEIDLGAITGLPN